jgi:hypothetical protein
MTKRRAFLIGFLGLVITIGVVKGLSMTPILGPAQKPIQSVNITVPQAAREQFFDQLEKFADLHGLDIRIAPTTPDNELYSVQMYREAISVIGNSSMESEKFFFGFYQIREHPIPLGSVDKLISALKLDPLGPIPARQS